MRPVSAFCCALALLATACQESHVDTTQVKQQMENRKVFHLTDAQVLAGADAVGRRVAFQLDSAQSMAQAEGDTSQSLSCVKALRPLIQALASEDIHATRLVFDNWQPIKDVPKVQQVLDAVRYTHSQGQPVPTNLQKDGQGGYHYIEGITVNSSHCLVCHRDWALGRQVGVYNIRFPGKAAVKEASKGQKGM